MNDLTVFNNPEFGEIRMIEVDGQPYAVGVDVAKALAYKDPTNAVKAHCKKDGVVKRHLTDSLGRKQFANFINEGNLYRLIVKAADQSVSEEVRQAAERFERWIFDEVLPTIRKTGEYKAPKARPHSLTEVNTTIKLITGLCDRAGVAPQFQLVAAKSIYAAVGIDIPVEGVTVARQLYEPTEIARKLGIMSSSGNPHAQAVGAIIAKLPIEKGEREPVPFSAEHGHYGTHYQYTESMINKVVWWLEQHSYPAKIEHNRKNYAVTYTQEKSAS